MQYPFDQNCQSQVQPLLLLPLLHKLSPWSAAESATESSPSSFFTAMTLVCPCLSPGHSASQLITNPSYFWTLHGARFWVKGLSNCVKERSILCSKGLTVSRRRQTGKLQGMKVLQQSKKRVPWAHRVQTVIHSLTNIWIWNKPCARH